MLKSRLISGVGIGTVILASTFFLSSCSNKITEEQLARIRELRGQERSLTESIQKKQNEKSSLDRELNARKSEMRDCQKEMDFVKGKLSLWPNVWPDYTPPQ